uniref:DNA packaging protein UL51 n=1 Tax=Panine betaherpesvirus 2 TaxID=188763 RepID=A0A8F7PMN9_9BETA|nr:DNA packaging protein UL51 [Panine betaherpesvirus 2]
MATLRGRETTTPSPPPPQLGGEDPGREVDDYKGGEGRFEVDDSRDDDGEDSPSSSAPPPLVIDEDAEYGLGEAEDDLLVQFEPMLPRVYDLLLPSLDARLNFVNAGQKYAAFLKYVHGECASCSHGQILREKTQLLTAIVTKLMDINGILEGKDELASGK